MTRKIFSTFDIKSVDEGARVVTGIASTGELDRQGDEVVPQGMQARLPIPFLMGHNQDAPIGHVISAQPTAAGILMKAQLVKIAEPGPLRDRLETAYQSIKSGLVKGLSLGFRSIETERIKTGLRFLKYELIEISAVVCPANASAGITSIKAIDQEWRRRHGVYSLKLGRTIYR